MPSRRPAPPAAPGTARVACLRGGRPYTYTCVSYGVNPRAYLHFAAKLIVDGWPHAKLRELLPDRIAAAHPELRVRTPVAPEMMGAADPPRLPPTNSPG
jgi:hypothetical protein